MGGGPIVASQPSPWLKTSDTSSDAPTNYLVTDSVVDNTSEAPVKIELDGALSQSPRPDENDAVGIENAEADDTEDEIATVTSWEQDSAYVQTVKAGSQPDTHPISIEGLAAEVKSIYAGLTMVESRCIEVDDAQTPPTSGPLDVTRYLLMIPNAKLILLQDGDMKPDGTVRTWFIKIQKDATKGNKETAASQVCSPDDYLHGFQVALELRAKQFGWPEHEVLTRLTTAEISEEGRKKVMDEKYLLDFGYELVDQFLRDFKAAKAKADNEGSDPNPDATPTCTGETADSLEAQSRPSDGTQAAPKETSPEEVRVALDEAAFKKVGGEEISPKGADGDIDVALDEVATQQRLDQDTSLSAQEPQTSPAEAGVAPKDLGKDTVDTAVDTIASSEKSKLKSNKKPETKGSCLVDLRPLNDQNFYKKVGKQHWVLIGGQWILSLNGEVYAALIALHRTLLHEHHDFFLASQHPSASPTLRRLATKYSMPARIWRHAIYAFLEVLRKRLPESQEFIDNFIILAYHMISLLDETVPQFLSSWIECKADLARYRMAIEDVDIEVKQRWRGTSKKEYTRVLDEDPTIGRIYHHLAILESPRSSSDANFDAYFDVSVSKFFYYTKSLIVKTPFFATRESVLDLIDPIVARNKEAAEKPASVPQTDQDHFLTAVVHLILACLEPDTLRKHGHKGNRNDHLQAVYAALEKIKTGGPAKTSRIRPSAKLGLLLCQLLLGIPLTDKRWSPMMAAWAPDLVTAEDRADSDAMANARDIHDATIELVRTMVPYLLEEADTCNLGVWGFIYVILVFMRSLKTRPNLLEWFGSAFHAKALAPFLNMLLREDETRGGPALESASQSELVTVYSLLNERQKPGKYGFSTEDNIKKYHREQEEQRKAERAKSRATTEETATSDAAHERDGDTKTLDWEHMYANVLPEHSLLSGLFFAPEATPAAVQTAEESAAEQAQEESLTDSKKVREAKEAEARRQEGLLRDPPLFPNGWFKNSKYSFDEIEVRDYVQNAETYYDRSNQILRLAAQLDGHFFVFKIDKEGRHWISVLGASSIPKPDPNKKMPEVIKRDGGARVVYVDPSSHIAEIEREKNILAREEERRKEKKHAEATRDVATAVNQKAEGDAEQISAASNIAEASQSTDMIEQQSVQISAYNMELDKTARIGRATTAAEELSNTNDAKPTEAGAETTLPLQGVDDSQDTKGSDVGRDAATASADDQDAATVSAEDSATVPHASVQLTEGVLDKMLGIENPTKAIKRWRAPRKGPGADEGVNEDGWTHIGDESHGDAETAPTVQTTQVDTSSTIWRLLFRR